MGFRGVWRGHGEILLVSTKVFLENHLTLQKGETGTIQAVYSKGGTLLTLTEKVIRRAKEHFKELLNSTNPPSVIEAELEDDEESTSVFLEEVAEVVKKTLHWESSRD